MALNGPHYTIRSNIPEILIPKVLDKLFLSQITEPDSFIISGEKNYLSKENIRSKREKEKNNEVVVVAN